ncbi:hypothetical protein JYU34_007786 [Plutella xylostella]|uniref:Uncharacterized protein n=1 Tax=Plutella xylostella TaxID=51655 RepID=A0ABQ7QR90_PLUXY|nr:hypothetical protein JYU34_007786 [Plutella xylostella]
MRRNAEPTTPGAGRGRSLIATRTSQQQQRRMSGGGAPRASDLPRSYSSPAPTHVPSSPLQPRRDSKSGNVARSYSTPEPKRTEYRRNSDFFYRPKSSSRSEIDSDLENFEQFEEFFIDTDPDQDQTIFGTYRHSPERDEPRRVTASLLPGSGLQRVSIKPISSPTAQTFRNAKEAAKQAKPDNKGFSRLNFRPLTVSLPGRRLTTPDAAPGVEELQTSPQLELEGDQLEEQLDCGERHLQRDVAMAEAESDAETVSFYIVFFKVLECTITTRAMK